MRKNHFSNAWITFYLAFPAAPLPGCNLTAACQKAKPLPVQQSITRLRRCQSLQHIHILPQGEGRAGGRQGGGVGAAVFSINSGSGTPPPPHPQPRRGASHSSKAGPATQLAQSLHAHTEVRSQSPGEKDTGQKGTLCFLGRSVPLGWSTRDLHPLPLHPTPLYVQVAAQGTAGGRWRFVSHTFQDAGRPPPKETQLRSTSPPHNRPALRAWQRGSPLRLRVRRPLGKRRRQHWAAPSSQLLLT